MKTCYVSRFGGLGDVLHAAHLPELIKKHYGVTHLTFETNYQGYQILQGNPFIDDLVYVDVAKLTDNRLRKNWDNAQDTHDLFFNLIYTIELEYCLNEDDTKYYRGEKYRRERFGKMSYYDVMTKAAGLPESYYGTRGQLYYEEEDHASAKEWVDKKREIYSHLILVNLSGTSLHKRFMQAETVSRRILEIYPKALVILTGDEHCKEAVFEHERVISWVAKKNIRTVALMSKYMDLTISVETGLPLIAHSWDAPCLHLLTAASPDNHCKYAKNAYWIQSPIRCSPCHKNPREYWGCPTQDNMPACVWFNEDDIVKKVEGILEHR